MYPNSKIRVGPGTSQQLSANNGIASSSLQKPESLMCAGREKKKPKPTGLGAGEEVLKLIVAEGLWGAPQEAPAAPGQVEGCPRAYLSGAIRASSCLLYVL